MKKFTVTTLGCKVNQYESEQIAGGLVDVGFQYVDTALPVEGTRVDLCIINTCTVTRKASMQSRQAVRQAVRSHPDAVIIVTGCYAQTEPEVLRKIEGVHHIVPHSDKERIPALSANLLKTAAHQASSTHSSGVQSSVSGDTKIPVKLLEGTGANKTRPFLKVQDG